MNFSQLMLLPKFVVFLGCTEVEIGYVMGAFSLSVLVFLPVVGFFSARIKKKTLFVMGAGVMCMATPLYIFVHDAGWGIYSLRIIQGVGFSSAFGISAAMVYDLIDPKSRVRALGIMVAFNISTHAMGPALGEYMIEHYGFDAYFISAGLFGLGATLVALFLPDTPKGQGSRISSFAHAIPVIFGAIVLGLVFGFIVIFLPPYLVRLGTDNSSPFFISFVCGSLAVWSLLSGGVSRMGDRLAWVAAALMFALLPLNVTCLGTPGYLVIISLAFGIGYGYMYPRLNMAVIDVIGPDKTGFANTLFVWSFNLGMLGASIGLGALCPHLGCPGTFRVTGIMALALLPLGLMIKKRGSLSFKV